MGASSSPDADLVRKVLAGDRSAYAELVERYWERIYVLAAHSKLGEASPEDVVQEAFIQAYRRLGALREPGKFAGWLSQIAMRLAGRMGRKAARAKSLPLEGADLAETGGPPREAEEQESRRHVREAVAALPDHYRLVVVLRFFEGMSCQEIADHLQEPIGTVWTRLHRANLILREQLGFLSPGSIGGA